MRPVYVVPADDCPELSVSPSRGPKVTRPSRGGGGSWCRISAKRCSSARSPARCNPVQPSIDLGRVMAGVRGAIEHVYAFETPEALADAGVDVHLGAARFEGSHTLVVGEQTGIRAEHILLCTGARAAEPSIPGLAETPHWTYETVWQQERLPRRLLVMGSGPVGIELTQAFARLGAEVTVVERGDRPFRMGIRKPRPSCSGCSKARAFGSASEPRSSACASSLTRLW